MLRLHSPCNIHSKQDNLRAPIQCNLQHLYRIPKVKMKYLFTRNHVHLRKRFWCKQVINGRVNRARAGIPGWRKLLHRPVGFSEIPALNGERLQFEYPDHIFCA